MKLDPIDSVKIIRSLKNVERTRRRLTECQFSRVVSFDPWKSVRICHRRKRCLADRT